MVTKPFLSIAAQCSKRTECMTDNFYINGALPQAGSVPSHKAVSKDVRARLGVFAVADGFGTGNDAENAAHKALSILRKFHEKMGNVSLEAIGSVVDAYAEEANHYMQSLGGDVGASVAMLIINNGVATAVNTGSARVYSFKYGRLNRLSIDDTKAQQLLNVGAIRREEAMTHPSRRELTGALGKPLSVQGGRLHMSSPTPVENGDIYLICSNGITDYLSDDRISYILSLHMSNERLSQRLVSEAVARGADDNLSVIIVRSGKNRKPGLINKGLVKGAAVVIALAILAAYLLSRPLRKPAGSGEVQPTATPSATPHSVLSPPQANDEFELR